MKTAQADLTTGPLGKQIFRFSIPLIFSNLLQVLFNMADVAVVGRFAGSTALGAVGSTTIFVSLFTGFLIGLSGGVNVLVAHHFGADDQKNLSDTVHSAALTCAAAGLVLLGIGCGFAGGILRALNTKPELMDGAVLYLRIYCLGMPALAVYNFGNAVFSAVGDTRRPLYYLSIAGVINVVLNLFFVIVCNMDVAGVAVASIISQYFSAILVTAALLRSRESYCLRFSQLRFHKTRTKAILSIGIPSGLQNAIFALANLFIQRGVNTFSATMVAGNSAATNADALVYDVMQAFYTACGSFIGQNYGAGKKDRIRRTFLISTAYAFGAGLLLGLGLLLFAHAIPEPLYHRPAGDGRGYVPSDGHERFLLRLRVYGRLHRRLPWPWQERCPHGHRDPGLLRVPHYLGLHRVCVVRHHHVPVSAVCVFLDHHGSGRDHLFHSYLSAGHSGSCRCLTAKPQKSGGIKRSLRSF